MLEQLILNPFIREHQKPPHRNQITPSRIRIGQRHEDQGAQQGLRGFRPMFLAMVGMRDEGVGEHAGILGAVVGIKIDLGKRIEGGGGHAADLEGIEDINVLAKAAAARLRASAASSCRNSCVLALGVDDERRALVEQQVGDDKRHAFASAASRDCHHMPVVVPADETPGPAAKQETAFGTPLIAGHLRGRQPARE